MTAAFDAQTQADTRKPVWWVEITTAHRCANTYADATPPSTCAAVDSGDGTRCFFSFKTCQDRANFRAEPFTWHYTSSDVPMPAVIRTAHPTARPMVSAVSPIAQRVSFSSSATSPGHVSITLNDTGGDMDAGPFDVDKTVRNSHRHGLTLQRWIAQWPNWGRMTVTVKLGFEAAGFLVSDYATQFVGTLAGIEVGKDGEWTLRAEDSLTKLKKSLPRQYSSSVVLGAVVAPADTSWTVNDTAEIVAGDQLLLTSVQGSDEIIDVTSVDSATTLTVVRATNGTPAGHILAGAQLFNVLDFKDVRPMTAVQTLLNQCGITDVNAASFTQAAEQIGPVALTRRIPGDGSDDTEQATALIASICELFQCVIFVEASGAVAVAMNRPRGITEAIVTVDDDGILAGSSESLGGEPQRLTHVAIVWDEAGGTTVTAAVNGETFVDDYFGSEVEDRKEKEIESAWLRPGSSVAYVAAVRWSHVFAAPPRGLEWQGSLRDYALSVGDLIETDTTEIQNQYGRNAALYMVVISRRPATDFGSIAFAAQASGFEALTDTGEGWGVIAPDATLTYVSASSAEQSGYTFWGDASNELDGDVGKVLS